VSQIADLPLHRRLGLTDAELDLIVDAIGRQPNDFELAVFSLLWSEHCGYKHSALLLRRLPTDGAHVLQGPGENAGVIDGGDGLALAFKVESHNHPSAIEPFQGAATGVGGILRDIFAMGARPIAILDSLRFGELGSAHARRLLDGAVRGIGSYGNCVGVANVGGEIVFEPGYEQNCLVNAMCVGVLPAERLQTARAAGPGNVVVLFGARTGRDGIGGASVLASQDIDQGDAEKRPSVQIGDPFTGKRLIECSLELVERELLTALQDLGAAGLASSSSEMAARGPVGLELDLDLVPLREADLQPFVVMLSESQERMLAVVAPERLAEVQAVCDRWELAHAVIGRVVEGDRLVCRWRGEVVGDLPATALVDACPRYPLEPVRPERLRWESLSPDELPAAPADLGAVLLQLLGAANVCDKTWVFRQYDHLVGSGTVLRPGGDAAVVRLTPSDRAIAVALDGNGRRTWLDPHAGGAAAVAEAALNVAVTGAEPAAVTNCLNFGNPERGETPFMLTAAIDGMAEACRALGLPVVSGNVSLYNEHAGGPIPPTPIVGCVGLLERAELAVPAGLRAAGDRIVLLGDGTAPALDGSEYQRTVHGATDGRPPALELATRARLHALLADAARERLLRSAHDASDGGVAVALAESALLGGLGVDVEVPDSAGRPDVSLFGEGPATVVASVAPGDLPRLQELAARHDVPLGDVGSVTAEPAIAVRCGDATLRATLAEAGAAHAGTLPAAMAGA
jgi:phosphoribosylformylglycinamidine synthase